MFEWKLLERSHNLRLYEHNKTGVRVAFMATPSGRKAVRQDGPEPMTPEAVEAFEDAKMVWEEDGVMPGDHPVVTTRPTNEKGLNNG